MDATNQFTQTLATPAHLRCLSCKVKPVELEKPLSEVPPTLRGQQVENALYELLK